MLTTREAVEYRIHQSSVYLFRYIREVVSMCQFADRMPAVCAVGAVIVP